MRLGRISVSAQLNRLALAGRTGALRISGDISGTIGLSRGAIADAECHGIPNAASRLARWPAGTGAGAPGAVMRAWVIREAIADSACAMLAEPPRSTRFTASEEPRQGATAVMTVAELLTEVNRRREVIRQLPAALTADTVVARSPRLKTDGVHVSASQWALLVRMNEQSSPRELAIGSGTSVFVTTLQVFRLINMGLVAIVDGPPLDDQAISFIRATS